MRTKVTIVVPAYNAELWLRDALDSAVAQTYPAHEIIVVDDGSKDRTGEIACSFGDRVRYLKQANQGVSAARNTALRAATGDWIAFLDSDDLIVPEKLATQVAVIEANPELVVVYSAFQFLFPDGNTLHMAPFPAAKLWPGLRYRTPILPSTAMIRRSALEEVGGFSTQYHYGEDWELWVRLIRRYSAKAFQDTPENLTTYRHWENNVTKNFSATAGAALQLLDSVLLADLSGMKRDLWKRKIEARIFYNVSLSYRDVGSERYWEYAIESFLKWPFWGAVVPSYRYRVLAIMLYTKLRNFRWSAAYWWPERRCREDLTRDVEVPREVSVP
ncbi:glycosyltransferase [Granulicella sp. S190]|uniref:glycosyltransferase family 2 protein n=1 Tax=Granulicella sp. S190 TaxID=1747226 RepID=UPI00131CD0DA|nr:glycosyltransferase [Granulicella sp. S190]